jgi:hypothetical protein
MYSVHWDICWPSRRKSESWTSLPDDLPPTAGRPLFGVVTAVGAEVGNSIQLFGVPTTGMGTYTSVIRPDGSIYGEGEGINMTQDGEGITWKGTGLGKFGPGGAVSYRGMPFFRTNSQKISLGSACGAFEYEVDGAGSTVSKIWEWK